MNEETLKDKEGLPFGNEYCDHDYDNCSCEAETHNECGNCECEPSSYDEQHNTEQCCVEECEREKPKKPESAATYCYDNYLEEVIDTVAKSHMQSQMFLKRIDARAKEGVEIAEKINAFRSLSEEEQKKRSNNEIQEIAQLDVYMNDIFGEQEMLAMALRASRENHQAALGQFLGSLNFLRNVSYEDFSKFIDKLPKELHNKLGMQHLDSNITEHFYNHIEKNYGRIEYLEIKDLVSGFKPVQQRPQAPGQGPFAPQ